MSTPVPQNMSEQQLKEIQNFLNKQTTGTTVQPGNEVEVKEIRKNFKTAANLLTQFIEDKAAGQAPKDKQAALMNLFEKLVEISQKHEEQLNLLKLNNNQIKQDTELTNLETKRIAEIKDKYSKVCLELSDATKKIKAGNKQMAEAEATQRQQLVDNFENSLKDITSKIDDQDKEREEKEKENNELKEELKKKVAEFEEKEKTYLASIQEKETEIKGKVDDFVEQIKSVETEAHEALRLKQELQLLSQSETEKKLKIALYSKRIDDLVSSIDKTNSTLHQFKENIVSMYWKINKLQTQHATLEAAVTKGDATLIEILQKNTEVEHQIESVKKQKEIVKQRVLETQAKIKAINAAK